jgi:hypothetical protein
MGEIWIADGRELAGDARKVQRRSRSTTERLIFRACLATEPSERVRRSWAMDRYEALLENYRNAWTGLHMIREAIEELGPVGVLPSPEAVIVKYGPEPIHEAQAIVDALATILGAPAGKPVPQSPAMDSGSGPHARPAATKSALRSNTGAATLTPHRERRRHRR